MIRHHPLINLASDPSASARAALVSATTEHFLDRCEAGSAQECELFADIVTRLYGFAHLDIRKKLAAALALADWAPQSLLKTLALDDIDIAAPVIALSPVIDNEILIEIVEAGSLPHQICVAGRPNISEAVSAKIIVTRRPELIGTLARNPTARIAIADFQSALDVLRSSPDDLDALIGRHDLPPSLIASAYALAGARLRRILVSRAPKRLQARLEHLAEFVSQPAVPSRSSPTPPDDGQGLVWGLGKRSPPLTHSVPHFDIALSPGALLAALMRGERDIFFRGLARLLHLSDRQIEQKLTHPQPETIALIARAAQFDVSLVRTLQEILDPSQKPWTPADERGVTLAWMRHSPASARQVLEWELRP
jgi:uncharacterized protein (DUF2336 family)